MRSAKTISKTAMFILLAILLSMSPLAANASVEDDGTEISIDLSAGINIAGGMLSKPSGFVFTAKVFTKSEGAAFETVHAETPRGDIFELEACEDESCFALVQEYETLRHFNQNHGEIGGAYKFIFDRDSATEDHLTIDYPYATFPDYYADILQPLDKDKFAPLQMVVKWELVPQWREYYHIAVELEDWLTGNRLFTSELLTSRETSLDLEKKYAILETDTEHFLTVRLLRKEEGEASTQRGITLDYTTSQFSANEIHFITTPDYYIGSGSSGTTCFINTIK